MTHQGTGYAHKGYIGSSSKLLQAALPLKSAVCFETLRGSETVV